MSVETWEIDPFDEEILANPYEYWREVRERGRLVWLSRYGIWVAGRYEEARRLFSDWPRFCSSRGVGLSDFKTEKPWRPPSLILEADPPDHTRARSAMTKALSPAVVQSLRPTFEAEAALLVEEVLEREQIDAVADLARPFPLKVFGDAVGIDNEDRENLLLYGEMVFNSLGPDNRLQREAMAPAKEVAAWIAAKCTREALAPAGLGAAVYSAADCGEITELEASLLVRSLLSAGVDTTVVALANAVYCFATHPDQWSVLRRQPERVRPAFEEVLRFEGPVHSFFRTVDVNTELGGVEVREGHKVLCVVAAANRDPAHWDRPDDFDIERRATGHLAFGTGIHACVGRTLARLEAEVLLSELAKRVQSIELCGEPKWRPNNVLRALDSLPVILRAN